MLSVLLGAHPAWASAGELIRLTEDFGIREPTLRVALTRMVTTGDLVRSRDGYRLSDRLLSRQRRQDDVVSPQLRSWDGTWLAVVVTGVGTDARSRAALRITLQDSRFAELREGVWMRPDNLQTEPAAAIGSRVRILRAHDADPSELAGQLWDLPGWARTGQRFLTEMAAAPDVPKRFVVAAGMVRHLLSDPVLPDELLPEDWPGGALRASYADFAAELSSRRKEVELMEAT